jgi:capsular polysaccharide transport system permease protein
MTVHNKFDIRDQRITLVRLADGAGKAIANPLRASREALARGRERLKVPVLLLSLPTIIAVIYFLGIAVSRYESVSTFVARSPSAAQMSELANLVQGSGVVSSADDAYIVNEYMVSRDAMHDLIANNGLLEAFSHWGVDPAWAPPGTFWLGNDERLYRYYQNFVSVEFNTTTGISTLDVQAFRPDDAQRIATALLQKSEALLNRMNERAQNDAIASAQKEVNLARENALEALQKVTDFRNREAVIDPTLQSTVVLNTMAGLTVQVAEANAQLAELLKSSPQSPQVGALHLRVTALDEQIAKERAQFGGNASSLAPRIAEYERLALEREFAARTFLSALNTLESAKVDAQRRRTYLEQVSRPNLPDHTRYPFRLTWIFAIAALNFALYWLFRHVLRDTTSHAKVD